jgi:uncharacterized protein
MEELGLAFGLILALEGALYALFPNGMKKMMLMVMAQPSENLRMTGLATAIVGVGIIWFLRRVLN